MIPHTIPPPLASNLNSHLHHPNSQILPPNAVQTSSFTFSQPLSNVQGVVITDIPSIPSHQSIIYQRLMPQKVVGFATPMVQQTSTIRTSSLRPVSDLIQNNNTGSQRVIQQTKREIENRSTGLFDIEKEELKDEVRRLQGLLKKNESEIQAVRRQLGNKNQALIELQRKLSSGESHKSMFNVQIKTLQEQNLKLKSIIDRMNIDRQELVKNHQKYMKNDQAVRIQIFGQVQKLQKVIQQKTKELQQSKQRQIIISKQFQGYRNQAGNQLNQGQRNTVHLMEKLKVALEGKELQIESLNQAIQQLDANLSRSQKSNSENIYKIKALQIYILQIEAQNTNLKEYQSHRQHEITFEANNELSILRSQVIELQRHLEVYREREKEAMSTYAGLSDKDQELKLKIALQDAENNQLTMQYLSKEIHNYRLIVQDLQSYKENGYKKDIEITRLHQIIGNKEKELIEVEGAAEELRVRIKNIEQNHHLASQRSEQQTRQLEQKCVTLNRKIQVLEAERVGQGQVGSAQSEIHISQLTKALDLSRNQYFSLRKASDQRIFNLESIKTDLENQIRSITKTIDQKEAERVFFQNQYKTLYSQFLEIKKHSLGYDSYNEVKDLKEKLFRSEEENHKLETQLVRIIEGEKGGRPTFNTGDDLSRIRGILDSHQNNHRKYQQHHRQTQSMSGLRQQNEHLKHLLEEAQRRIQEYATDLDQCQNRMGLFQGRMENLLAGGNGRQASNYQEYVHEQKQVMEQVQELKNKLKAFKKQNDQLKRKVKQSKQERRARNQERPKNRDSQKKRNQEEREAAIQQNAEIVNQNKMSEKKIQELIFELDTRQKRIVQLSEINTRLNSQIVEIKEINAHNQGTLKEYESNISEYEKAMNRYEARIKEYQNHMLKIKHKYKQEAHTRLPEPDIERPTNSVQNVSERLQFFRVKSQEAEQRVKHLLKINNQLKFQLQQTSSLVGGENLSSHKIQLLENTIQNLEKKLVVVAQENIQLKARMETVDDNPNLSTILEVKMRQLMQENSELRVQISQANSEIFTLKQQNQIANSSSEGDLQKFQYLQSKFQGLNQIIQTLEGQKFQLQSQNNDLKNRVGKENITNQNILLEQISNLQQENYQLKVLNRELEVGLEGRAYPTTSNEGIVSMESYSALLIEVDKLIRFSDSLHMIFSSVIDVIAKTDMEELKLAIDGYVLEASDTFKSIDIIKDSLGGLRQQSEAAIMIHEMNQII